MFFIYGIFTCYLFFIYTENEFEKILFLRQKRLFLFLFYILISFNHFVDKPFLFLPSLKGFMSCNLLHAKRANPHFIGSLFFYFVTILLF